MYAQTVQVASTISARIACMSHPAPKSARGLTMEAMVSHSCVSMSKRSTLLKMVYSHSFSVKPPMQNTSGVAGSLMHEWSPRF